MVSFHNLHPACALTEVIKLSVCSIHILLRMYLQLVLNSH